MTELQIPPCSSGEVLTFIFESNNLKKFLEHLLDSDQSLLKDVKSLQTNTENLFNSKKIIDEFIESQESERQKTSQLQNELNSVINRVEESEKKLKDIIDNGKIESLEKNVNSLNRINEDLVKKIDLLQKDINEKTSTIKSLENQINIHSELIDKNVEQNQNSQSIVVKKIQENNELTNQKLDLLKKQINDAKTTTNSKVTEIDDQVFKTNKIAKENSEKIKTLLGNNDTISEQVNNLVKQLNSLSMNNNRLDTDGNTPNNRKGTINQNMIINRLSTNNMNNIISDNNNSNDRNNEANNNSNNNDNVNNNNLNAANNNNRTSVINNNNHVIDGSNVNVGAFFVDEVLEDVRNNTESIKELKLVLEGALSGLDRSRLTEEELQKKLSRLSDDVTTATRNSQSIKLELLEKINTLPDWSQNMLKFELKNEKFNQSINTMQENLKTINLKVGAKAEKDNLDRKIMDVQSEISKYQLKMEESMRNLEIKTKVLLQKLYKEDDENQVSPMIVESIQRVSKETLMNLLTNSLTDHLENNDYLNNKFYEGEKNKNEINKLYESITSIRESVLDRNKVEEKLRNFSEFEFQFNIELKLLRKKIDEIVANIEGDQNKDDTDRDKDFATASLKDQIKQLGGLVKMLQVKQSEVTDNFDSVKKDLYLKIKKDLNCKFTIIFSFLIFIF